MCSSTTTPFEWASLRRRIGAELLALFRRPLYWGTALAVSGFSVLLQGLLYLSIQHANNLPAEALNAAKQSMAWPQSLSTGLEMIAPQALGGLAVLVLSTLFVAQEYSWGSLALVVSRGTARRTWLLSKILTLAIGIVGLLGIQLVVAGAFGILVTAGNNAIQTEQHTFGVTAFAQNVGAVLYGLLPYAALGILLAVATRSAAVALGIGLGYTLLVEPLLAALSGNLLPKWMGQYLLRALGEALQYTSGEIHAQLAFGSAGASKTPAFISSETAILLIAIYVILFLVAGTALLSRQDL